MAEVVRSSAFAAGSRPARNPLDTLWQWQFRFRARRRLAQLDDRMLNDIGLDRHVAAQEIAKPFWRA